MEFPFETYIRNVVHEAGINNTQPKKRIARTITNKSEVDEILSIDHYKASKKTTTVDMFGDFGEGSRFNPYDIITIPKGLFGGLSLSSDPHLKEISGFHIDSKGKPIEPDENDFSIGQINTSGKYIGTSTKKNLEAFTTTVGSWIFNRWFIEPICDITGYWTNIVTNKSLDDINSLMSNAILEDKMSIQQLKNFINDSQILMGCCSVIASSHTEGIYMLNDVIKKKKAEILSRPGFKDRLDNGDLVAMREMEDELINESKKFLRDDPCIDMYNSGSRADWGNNFKNMYLMRSGMVGTNGTTKIVTDGYIDGLKPEDYVAACDASIGGGYNRSQLTRNGGYKERLFFLATAHIKYLSEGSDCKTKRYIEVELNKKNIKEWLYSFIIDNDKLVELTPDIADKYIDKKVKMRFSALCEAKHSQVCEKCGGTLFRRLNMLNVGMASSIMMSSVKNTNMKKMHCLSIKLTTPNINKVFSI